jgi:DNA invertase Pin-like site-specific DNA recombinase
MAKAFSYVRFSTPEQSKGDSFRRQTDLAARYCAQHKLELADLTLHDLGVSAFRGANSETGALGAFKRAIEDGAVPAGSVLLVESLDRISRQVARKAVRVIEDIVEAGVDVVTLADGKRYTKESLNGFDFLMAVLLLIRGNEESETKSRRLKAAWSAKRATAGSKVLTSRVPGWLTVVDGKAQLVPERAKVVRRIFKDFVGGTGARSIAVELNDAKVPTFERAEFWRGTYVASILGNRAAVGEYTPHVMSHDATTGRKVRVPQAAVVGYYPAVVDGETFERAQALLTKGRPRGRHATKTLRNPLATLARCPLCGGSMTRVIKGTSKKSQRPFYVCAKAKAGAGCAYHTVRADAIEAALLHRAHELIAGCPHPDATIQSELDSVEHELMEIDFDISNLVDTLTQAPSVAVSKRLAALEAQAIPLRVKRDALLSKAAQTDTKLIKRRVERLKIALTAKPFDVANANTALRECFEYVTINYQRDREVGTLAFGWRHDGETELNFEWNPDARPRSKKKVA